MSPHHPPRQSLAALLRSPAAASGSENTGDATGDAAADVTADTVSDAAQARSDALPAADAGIPATAAPAMATQTETVPLPAADGTPLTAAGAAVEATPTFLRQHRPGTHGQAQHPPQARCLASHRSVSVVVIAHHALDLRRRRPEGSGRRPAHSS